MDTRVLRVRQSAIRLCAVTFSARAGLGPPPPLKAITVATAGLALMMSTKSAMRACISWNEVSCSPWMAPMSRPVSRCGNEALGDVRQARTSRPAVFKRLMRPRTKWPSGPLGRRGCGWRRPQVLGSNQSPEKKVHTASCPSLGNQCSSPSNTHSITGVSQPLYARQGGLGGDAVVAVTQWCAVRYVSVTL